MAFHKGLGEPIYPTPSTPYQTYLNADWVALHSAQVYAKSNIVLVADGAEPETLTKWTNQFFEDVVEDEPSTPQPEPEPIKIEQSSYYGGEQRLSHKGGNSIVIAFPGSSYKTPKPEMSVLAALLGGQSTIKWSPGFGLVSKSTAELPNLSVSAKSLTYSDAGLLTIQMTGSAASVRQAAFETVKAVESVANGSVSKEDITKAIANAKFKVFEDLQLRGSAVLHAGSSLVNNGQIFDQASFAKSIDGVTAETLKKVRLRFVTILFDTLG